MQAFSLEHLSQLQKEKRLTEARALCDQALTQHPKQADLWHFSGILAIEMGELDRGLEDFLTSLLIAPNDPTTHKHLGNTLRMLGRLHEAISHYEQALALDPDYAEARNNLGNIFYRQGDYEAALKHYLEAIRIDPDYGDAHFNIANIYALQDEYAKARTHYLMSIEFQPENPITYFNLAMIERHLGSHTAAIQTFWKYIERAPQNYEGHYYLALCYTELDKTSEAIEQYLAALALAPHHPESNYNLAVLYQKQGNLKQAIHYYERSSQVNPGNRSAQFLLAALSGNGAPEFAPLEHLRALFDQYAGHYNAHLRERLIYRAPELLEEAFLNTAPEHAKTLKVVDLGCGTGLCGPLFRPYARELIGVDLSEAMLKHAEETKAYDALIHTDILSFLALQANTCDVLVAADVFIYVGDLKPYFESAAAALTTNGLWLFTLEASSKPSDYHLEPSGRFQHSKEYIETLAAEHLFHVTTLESVSTRLHEDKPILAWRVVLRKGALSS